jgi:hypothetical protein
MAGEYAFVGARGVRSGMSPQNQRAISSPPAAGFIAMWPS